ncbi:MAG TPA: EAL domain-containing protein [Steroidobacteraceae bacterium]|nr:EAL domain-containing protein [Steroidobacteraceae bacterium]
MNLQSIGDAVITTDAAGRIEYLNPVAEKLTGWAHDEARGRLVADVLNLVNEITRDPIDNPLLNALQRQEGGGAGDHSVLITRGGQEVAIQECAGSICDTQGRVIGTVVVFHDVTKERRLKRALSYQARHDPLTGLLNSREFDNRLIAAVSGAQSGETSYALLYLDLDRFKVINDTCGHHAGDHVLRDVTAVLQARVRASDAIGRLGGDEFGVLLERCTPEQATHIADGIRQAIRDYRLEWSGTRLSIGASIGVVEIGASTESVAAVMRAADAACYAAKDDGRDRVHLYEAAGDPARYRETQWAPRIERAAQKNWLELFLQPILPVAAGSQTTFYELSARLRDDDNRLVSPAELIRTSDRHNVLVSVDRWIVSRTLELLEERRQRSQALPLLAVSLSAASVNERTFSDFILQNITQPDIAAALCFEVTESEVARSLANTTAFMRELKSRGCRLGLNDFGSGLGSLSYLKSLPVDFLRIDGSLVGHVVQHPVDRGLVEAISRIGKSLGIATVAKGVDNDEVMREIAGIGVDFVQGQVVASCVPAVELART